MRDNAYQTISLGDVADVRPGYPFRGPIAERLDGEAAVVQIKNVAGTTGINWAGVIRTNLEGRRKPDWLDRGDIVFTARGNRNAAAFVGDVPVRAVAAPSLFLIRLRRKDVALPEFVAWVMNQANAQRYLSQSATGSYITSIRKEVLLQMPLSLPGLEKQRLIVELDEAVRRERELLEELIANRQRQLSLVATSLMD